MPKRPRAYLRPKSLEAALQALQEPDTVPLGGGTKLLAGDITGTVVDLQALELDHIELKGNLLGIGAMVRLANLVAYLEMADKPDTPAVQLAEATHRAGPNTYRNAATFGGSIAARLPDSELVALLLALDAHVALADGRVLSLPEYWASEGQELIIEVRVPWGSGRGAAERVARTPADYPIVSVCLWQPTGGDPRVAATGVDDLPTRLPDAETALRRDDMDGAVQAAEAACRHPGDFRGSAAYRRQMVGVLLRRLAQA